ncbi:MAG: hypothetical protein NZ735_00465, partial [Candidatus Marinimicrobia bacterium]|nr:hypothetical protein [Candidatus Neomarinimicrobiota bacterium]
QVKLYKCKDTLLTLKLQNKQWESQDPYNQGVEASIKLLTPLFELNGFDTYYSRKMEKISHDNQLMKQLLFDCGAVFYQDINTENYLFPLLNRYKVQASLQRIRFALKTGLKVSKYRVSHTLGSIKQDPQKNKARSQEFREAASKIIPIRFVENIKVEYDQEVQQSALFNGIQQHFTAFRAIVHIKSENVQEFMEFLLRRKEKYPYLLDHYIIEGMSDNHQFNEIKINEQTMRHKYLQVDSDSTKLWAGTSIPQQDLESTLAHYYNHQIPKIERKLTATLRYENRHPLPVKFVQGNTVEEPFNKNIKCRKCSLPHKQIQCPYIAMNGPIQKKYIRDRRTVVATNIVHQKYISEFTEQEFKKNDDRKYKQRRITQNFENELKKKQKRSTINIWDKPIKPWDKRIKPSDKQIKSSNKPKLSDLPPNFSNIQPIINMGGSDKPPFLSDKKDTITRGQ